MSDLIEIKHEGNHIFNISEDIKLRKKLINQIAEYNQLDGLFEKILAKRSDV